MPGIGVFAIRRDMKMCDRLFVVTGGPGSGKTALIEALAREGISCMPEAGRAVIQHQLRIDGTALPWADRAAFAELMLNWDIRSHDEASRSNVPVMMDRGIGDVVGYLTLCGLSVPAHVKRAAELYRYNPRVFIAPYWEEIFTQDAERKQDEAEARATFEVMAATYGDLGYELTILPFASVSDRAAFVLEHLQR